VQLNNEMDAAIDYHRNLRALTTDYIQELSYYDKKRIHNLKYFTWVEQQGKDLEELNAQMNSILFPLERSNIRAYKSIEELQIDLDSFLTTITTEGRIRDTN